MTTEAATVASSSAINRPPRSGRPRLGLRGELLLVALPTVAVIVVFGIVERFTHQRLLFASLVSSAFLIYLDPEHPTNKIRTLLISQLGAAVAGAALLTLFGPGYVAAAAAMLVTIIGMVTLDVVHPPAVSTALAFAFRGNDESNLLVFAAAVAVVALLVAIEQLSLWLLRRAGTRSS